MTNHSPPLSPRTNLSASTQNQQTVPTLPHDIIAAAHCLAPLDDLHLAHLVNELKPPPPVWSIYCDPSNTNDSARGPVIESNDRLRTDELADLPAPEAERLHAAYDIEDHLDCSPNRLLVFGPSTPLVELLRQVKQILIKNRSNASLSTNLSRSHSRNNNHHTHSQSTNQVYVARVWFQPNEGPHGLYKWVKGGADLIRFEIDPHLDTSVDEAQPVIIHWSPVEVALSQALEVGHQLLALLHSRQFTEILESISDKSTEFRAINPIVWLVDPVEYAHAQLRETTEWGWSEHHVELNPLNLPLPTRTSRPSSNASFTSTATPDSGRRHSKSHLSHELCALSQHDDQPQSPPPDPHLAASTSSSRLQLQSKSTLKSLSDDLPSWLDDLLDRRLPCLLSLPDGCLSYELLNHPHPVNTVANNMQLSRLPPVPFTLSSPLSDQGGSGQGGTSPPLSSKMESTRWSMLSAMGSPSRLFGLDQRSLANSVPSFDQHYIPSPGLAASLRHGQTNTLRYYPCKACAEHAFKLALSHKLNEEKRRNHLPRSAPMRSSRSSQVHHHHHHHHHPHHHLGHHKKGSRNGSTSFAECPPVDQSTPSPSSSSLPPPSSSTVAANHMIDCLQSFATVIDQHLNPQVDTALKLPIDNSTSSSSLHASTNTNSHTNTNKINTNTSNTYSNTKTKTANYTSPIINPEPVIGLGTKGKALKEAMDREDDEFIKQHPHLHHSHKSVTALGESYPARLAGVRPYKHTWDEGEDVDD